MRVGGPTTSKRRIRARVASSSRVTSARIEFTVDDLKRRLALVGA
jgi:hypothetical protein